MAPNTPQMGTNAPGAAPVAKAVPPTFDKDGNMVSPPVNSPGTAPAAQTGLGGAFRGSTPDEIAAFRAGAPGGQTPASAETNNTLAANAGKGNVVQTPYGTASSTDVKNGPGQNWQQQLVSKYPTLGIAGHPDNVAFVKAYKDAAKNGTPDHAALADSIVGPSGDQPTPEGQVPQFGVPNALQPQNRTAGTAQTIGKSIHDAPGAIGDAVGGVIKSTVGAAKNFYAGLTGNTNANTGANSIDPPVIPGGTQSPKQIADASARAGLDAQQNTAANFVGPTGSGGGSFDTPPPTYAGTDSTSSGSGGSFAPSYSMPDAHADIHAATVKAITTAGQNAHDAINTPGTAAPVATPSYTPQPDKTNSTAGY